MSKIDLTTVDSGFLSQTAVNANFTAIEQEFQNKVLYRSNPTGEPNSMQQDLDMNGHRILNQLAEGGDGFIWKRSWGTSLPYEVNNIVYVPSGLYEGYAMICTSDHTSSALFQTDYDLDRWEILASRGASGAGTGDLAATNNLSDVASPSAALTNLNGMPKSGGTFTGDIIVPNEDYDAGTWETNFEVPTKGAIRNKFESLPIILNGTNDPTLASTSSTDAVSPEWVRGVFSKEVNMQVFTSSGTFTVPQGVTKLKVTVSGGGGGSGGSTSGSTGGGGAGGCAIKIVDTSSLGSSVSVTVGTGGVGGGVFENGGTGQASSFGSVCSATGGNGSKAQGGTAPILGGDGGIGTGGNLNIRGQTGGFASGAATGRGVGGVNPSGYGRGADGRTSGGPGASGSSGVVIVEW